MQFLDDNKVNAPPGIYLWIIPTCVKVNCESRGFEQLLSERNLEHSRDHVLERYQSIRVECRDKQDNLDKCVSRQEARARFIPKLLTIVQVPFSAPAETLRDRY